MLVFEPSGPQRLVLAGLHERRRRRMEDDPVEAVMAAIGIRLEVTPSAAVEDFVAGR